jgi:hypothetical protein
MAERSALPTLPAAKMCLLKPSRHGGGDHATISYPHDKDRFFCIFRFVAHTLIIPLHILKWSNSKTCVVPFNMKGLHEPQRCAQADSGALRGPEAADPGLGPNE